jgi:outer membrane protein OmpA-like peptidoglycan-associated protein
MSPSCTNHTGRFFYQATRVLVVFFLCLHSASLAQIQGDPSTKFSIAGLSRENVSEFPRASNSDAEITIVKENLGQQINSRFEETKPILSPDGKCLYFARKHSPENVGGSDDPQDIWMATSENGARWSTGKNLGKSINTRQADNLCAVIDNNTFAFFISSGKNKGNFGLRQKQSGIWSDFESTGPEVLNESPYLESFFSADGTVILYTAKTKNNIAYRKEADERDIYISVKQNNHWSSPANLGSIINSSGDEFSPFLSADGRTLYFGTNGRGGSGDVDIFMSRRMGDGWTSWTAPVNLGPEINTNQFDAYFTLSEQTKEAYMVSYSNTYGKGDIVRVKLPDALQPDQPVYFPLTEKIKAENKADKKTDLTTLPNRAATGETLQVHNVLFEKGTAVMRENSMTSLNELISLMKKKSSIEICLLGHTDNIGSSAMLQRLSEARVVAVKNYLVKNGIHPGRISGKAYGRLKPLVKNDSEQNRMINRRVEFLITGM